VRGEVEDRLVADEGRCQRVGVEEVRVDRLDVRAPQDLGLLLGTGQSSDVVAGIHQCGDRGSAHHPGRTGDENLHAVLTLVRSVVGRLCNNSVTVDRLYAPSRSPQSTGPRWAVVA